MKLNKFFSDPEYWSISCMMILNKNQQGVGVIKLLFFIPLVLIGLVILFYIYTELNKAYWDREVRVLCEKDGGATVFEKVELTKEEYDALPKNNGFLSVPIKRLVKDNQNYYSDDDTTVLNESNPNVRRVDVFIKRKSDEKVIAKYSSFHRVGGDIPTGISHPSHFSCPDPTGITKFINSIFVIKGE